MEGDVTLVDLDAVPRRELPLGTVLQGGSLFRSTWLTVSEQRNREVCKRVLEGLDRLLLQYFEELHADQTGDH